MAENREATEHVDDNFLPLSELTPQSATIGSWVLVITETPREWEYSCTWIGRQCPAKRFEIALVSRFSNAYCVVAFTRKGKDEKRFKVAIQI